MLETEREEWRAERARAEERTAALHQIGLDLEARNATIGEIWETVQSETIYLPVHHQVLNWGMADRVVTTVDPEDTVRFKYFTFAE